MELVSIIIILIGVLLKIIDDHYDMNMFSDTIAKIAQIGIVVLSIFLFTKDKAFTLVTMITCIYVLCAEGQMEDVNGNSVIFYYIFVLITFVFFIYQLLNGGYNEIFNSITMLEIARILLFGLFIYYENKFIPEDISYIKFMIRALITLVSMGYIYYEHLYNKRTLIIREVYLLAIGYMGISVINILFMMNKLKTPPQLSSQLSFHQPPVELPPIELPPVEVPPIEVPVQTSSNDKVTN